MNTLNRTIEVNTILFESNDPDILVKGIMSKGHMKFETDVVISHSQLNALINQLNKQNTGLEVNEFIQSERMYNDQTLYTAQLDSVANRSICLSDLPAISPIRQIRA